MTFYTIVALCAFLLTLIGTRLMIPALRRRTPPTFAMLRGDQPFPVPTGGGIALLFALIIGLMVADISYVMVLALLLLASVSLLDDLIGIPKPVHIIVQIMAVIVALISFHHPIFGGIFPFWLDRLLAGLLWLGAANLFHSLDEMDGLSATQMICMGIGVCMPAVIDGAFPDPVSVYGLIIASAACGFLWWSWPPAKVRLGEVGSIPSGFLLGYLLLLAIANGYGYAAILLPAYYLSDGLITHGRHIYERRKGRKLSGYYYQLALANGRRKSAVIRYISAMNILLIFLTTRSVLEPQIAIFNVSMGYMAVFMLLGFFAHDPHPTGYDI